MTIQTKAASLFALVAGAVLFAGSAQATLLTNGGFESPNAAGGDVYCSTGWSCFNAGNFTNNTAGPSFGPVSHEPGSQSLKQFGIDGGAFQNVAAVAGTPYQASVWAMNWVGDPLKNLGIAQLTFWDGPNATGNAIGKVEAVVDSINDGLNIFLPVQDGAQTTDWTKLTLNLLAPTGTVSAKFLLIHVPLQGAQGGGTVRWDDAQLAVVPAPPAVWLLGTAVLGLVGRYKLRRRQTA